MLTVCLECDAMFKIGLMLKVYLMAKPEYIEFYLYKDGNVTSACWGGELFSDNESSEKAIKILEDTIKIGILYQMFLPYSCVKVTPDGECETLAVVW